MSGIVDTRENRLVLIRAAGLDDLLDRFDADVHAAASIVIEMKLRLQGIAPPAAFNRVSGAGAESK